jgi:HEAT repeat protein
MSKKNSISKDYDKDLRALMVEIFPVLMESGAGESKKSRQRAKEITALIEKCNDLTSLRKLLDNSNDEIRCSAIHAIGKLDASEVYSLLETAITDPSPSFRLAAVEAITDGKYTDLLLKALQDESSDVRERGIWSLQTCRDTRAVGPLINIMCDPDEFWRCRVSAVSALGGYDEPRIADLFYKNLEDETIGEFAARELGNMRDPRGYELLLAAMVHGTKAARMAAVGGITDYADERALAPLLTMLAESDLDMKREAAYGLAYFGRNLREKIPYPGETAAWSTEAPLCEAFACEDEEVRENVLFALGEIGSPRAVEVTLIALGDSSARVKSAAIRNVEKLNDRRLATRLIPLLDDDDVRDEVMGALGDLGDTGAINPVANYLDYDDFEMKIAASKCLVKLGDRRGWPILVSALTDRESDWTGFDRAVIADVMHGFDATAAFDVFLELLPTLDLDHDSDYQVFMTVVGALGNSGDPRAIAPLFEFLDDEYTLDFQAVAAQALLNLGDARGWHILATALTRNLWSGPQMNIRRKFLTTMVRYDKEAAGEVILQTMPLCNPANEDDRNLMELMVETLAGWNDPRAAEMLQKNGNCK